MWIGYFDEALTGESPEGHGLVRFGADLQPEWLYPWRTALPRVDDCEAMNVTGETVVVCAYSDHHLITVTGQVATDLGPAPHRGARALLLEGNVGVLIGGYGPDHDLVTPFELSAEGPMQVGQQGRVVLPGGFDVQRVTWTCREGEAWALIGDTRYRLNLSRVLDILC